MHGRDRTAVNAAFGTNYEQAGLYNLSLYRQIYSQSHSFSDQDLILRPNGPRLTLGAAYFIALIKKLIKIKVGD
jgi:hypothetical protein